MAYLIFTQSDQYVAFADSKAITGLSDWIEQLVAESTGKDQKGRVPVVLGGATEAIGSKQMLVTFEDGGDLVVSGDLTYLLSDTLGGDGISSLSTFAFCYMCALFFIY